MAKSNFINYFAYKDVQKTLEGCITSPNKGIIKFFRVENNTTYFTHFTGNAKINLVLYFKDQSGSWSISKSENLSKIKNNNIYTFSAKDLISDKADYQSFQKFSIEISEGNKTAKIILVDTNSILSQPLFEYNNIFFRFSYDVTDENCHQFDNCILHIGQDINSNITYTNWISPIASGNDISTYIGVTTESSSTTNESTPNTFKGSLEKCIKATSSSTWLSAFKEPDAETTGPISIPKYYYNGKIKSSPSKTYDVGNLVRFQDIDLTSIDSTHPKVDYQ